MAVVLKPAVKRHRRPSQFLAEGERRVILVGICGPSGSGKTTLAQELVKNLGTPLGSICADHFYDHSRAPVQKRRDGKSKRTKYERNLEVPDVIDSEMLLSELIRVGNCLADEEWLPDKVVLQTPLDSQVNLTKRGCQRPGSRLGSDPVVLIAEGFLLFHKEEIALACTHRLWLDIDCDSAMKRRFNREGEKEGEIDDYYERWYRDSVWYSYETYRSIQLDNANQLDPGAFHIDASQSSEQMLDEAMRYLNAHLNAGGIRQERKQQVILRSRKHLADSRERYELDNGWERRLSGNTGKHLKRAKKSTYDGEEWPADRRYRSRESHEW